MGHASSSAEAGHHPAKPLSLLVAAVGVVYGDIGTSPLYTLKEVFSGGYGVQVSHDGVLGILSLIFWSLIWVVSFKYMAFVLRADNQGEGGIMALTALARRATAKHPKLQATMIVFGLFGAALFYGDSMITPAISVLSAIEGMELAFDGLEHWVVPISLVVLVGLFLIQRHGTARIGILFGPVMVTWFVVLGVLGVYGILQQPEVLHSVNPMWALRFFIVHPGIGVAILGAVVLALTGAEALYADMGHFGRKPISRAWFALVLPALVLNYFGQGALVLQDPEAVRNPFYLLAPSWALLPLIALSTLATVIASQAVISGAFSMTLQAIQLGYIPRMFIQHTSSDAQGQIYIGAVNWSLMVGVILLVLGFESSGALASAYHDSGVIGDADAVEMASLTGRADPAGLSLGGRVVFCGERTEDRAGRCFSVRRGYRAVHSDDHLEARQTAVGGTHRRRRPAVADLHQQHSRAAAAPGSGHRCVSDSTARRRPTRAAAQSSAQPGAA
jgi:KUP system potassium uptake protein